MECKGKRHLSLAPGCVDGNLAMDRSLWLQLFLFLPALVAPDFLLQPPLDHLLHIHRTSVEDLTQDLLAFSSVNVILACGKYECQLVVFLEPLTSICNASLNVFDTPDADATIVAL